LLCKNCGAGEGTNLEPDALIAPAEQLPHSTDPGVSASSYGRAFGAGEGTNLEPDALIAPAEQLPHSTDPGVSASSYGRAFGAAERTYLEPNQLSSVLEELESWEAYLKAEPELIHKLRAFENAAAGEENEQKNAVRLPTRPRGPSL
jgi:hypothetical protein